MRLFHKDHKNTGKLEVRRLNGPGMNIHVSNVVAELLEPIAGMMLEKKETMSTESVLSMVDKYNQDIDREETWPEDNHGFALKHF